MIEMLRNLSTWIRKNATPVIAVLFAAGLVAGFFSLIGLGVTPWDAVFYTLQMIVLNYDKPEGTTPSWLYHVSRLGLPALASWALIKAYMTLAGRSVDQWMARRCSNHILICGSGDQAKMIASSHLKQDIAHRKSIVLLTLAHGQADLEKLQREGVKVVEGDATDEAVLGRLAIDRASVIYIVAGADEVNLRVLESVKKAMSPSAMGRQITCLVHVFDDYLSRQTLISTRDWLDDLHLNVVPFNSWKESARRALVQIGPDLFCSQPANRDKQPHAMIIGYSWFGQQLVEQFARLGHYTCSQKLKVTLITPCATASRARLLTRFPALDGHQDPEAWGECAGMLPIIDLEIIEAPVDGFAASDLVRKIMSTVSVTYVCAENAESGLAVTNALLLQTPQLQFPIYVSTNTGLEPLRHFIEKASARVRVFDALGQGLQLCDNEAFLRQHTEREAALVHLYFTQEHGHKTLPPELATASVVDLANSLRGGGSDAARMDWLTLDEYWAGLPEWMRESSRDTVRHLPIKQRAIDKDLFVQELSAGEKELLSRIEHTRWVSERLLSGWRYAPKHPDNADKRLHHDLVMFERLGEQSKQKDASIIYILRLLAQERQLAQPAGRVIGRFAAPAGHPVHDSTPA